METTPTLIPASRGELTALNARDAGRRVQTLLQTRLGGGTPSDAAATFALRWPRSVNLDLVRKAAIAAGTTTDGTWAAPLASGSRLAVALLDQVRPISVLGRLPDIRRVPFNTAVAAQTGTGTYGWVGEGRPKPLSSLAFAGSTLPPTKVSGIIVSTEELIRASGRVAEDAIRRDITIGIAKYLDDQLLDPTVAAAPGVRPASLTNGTAAIPSSGDVRADIAALAAAVLPGAQSGAITLVASFANAAAIAASYNATTFDLRRGGLVGGFFLIPSAAAGSTVVMIDEGSVIVAEDDGLVIDLSKSASVQMDSAPTDPPVANTVLVSLWQLNLIGVRGEQMINWLRSRADGVRYVNGAAYTA